MNVKEFIQSQNELYSSQFGEEYDILIDADFTDRDEASLEIINEILCETNPEKRISLAKKFFEIRGSSPVNFDDVVVVEVKSEIDLPKVLQYQLQCDYPTLGWYFVFEISEELKDYYMEEYGDYYDLYSEYTVIVAV